ncbi:hypothetical protein COY27_06605 [Candidatus Woesearchaeota archaeon CG_4_10_14_0_2_um_filter_33_13]|nr:MAG: hypothetical protein COY27_06605 [Candidatus Woesearchaeota archaeon CG_4_10_14_0_2_um_filter_33_13]
MVDQNAKAIELKADSDNEFFLIHGYTGSPTDFNQLPYHLHKKFNANVRVIMLKGHGTKVEDLDDITFNDLLTQIETALREDINKGRKIILGGLSLGAVFALHLSAEYPVRAVFNICPTYILRFPFNVKGIEHLGKYKKYWKKPRKTDEKLKREGTFSYDYMHANGIKIVREASNKLKDRINKIKCPIMTICSITDPIGHQKSLKEIHNNVKSSIKRKKIFRSRIHNIFFSKTENLVYKEVSDFVKENNLFDLDKQEKIAAIIPSYNEAERIGEVLKVLCDIDILDEIIVIDDGSTDNTKDVVKNFEKVKYYKNKNNIGKAGSMDLGVKSTDAEIIFFCDADLIDLKPEIVTKIIEPVKNGNYNMFIGLRGNFMQKTVHLFAINSGERALRRIVWEELPKQFKYRYRVEAGLNYCVKKYFGGFGYKEFDYSQPLKEKKYGFIKGTILRWSMNIDVLIAYIQEIFGKA